MAIKEHIKVGIFLLVLAGLGVAMILHPELGEGVEVSGRRSLLKFLIVWIWSVPGGIVLILLSVLSLLGSLTSDDEQPAT